MGTHKSHTAEYESPCLRVVDLPTDLGLPKPLDISFQTLRNQQQGDFHRHKQRTYKGKKTSSKYKGVSWVKRNNHWVASIRYYGKFIYLSSYGNEKEAALAYDKAALQLFGEYARTNQMIYPEDFK